MARLMWVFAVSGLITMRPAIWSLDRQCVEDVFVEAVVGQDDDVHPGRGRVGGDAPGRLDAVDDRYLDVDERNVGQVLLGEGQALHPVAGLGHDLDVAFECLALAFALPTTSVVSGAAVLLLGAAARIVP